MFKRKRAVMVQEVDPDLALIERYRAAIVQSYVGRVCGGDTPAVIAQERAAVEALAGRIADALREAHRARTTPCR